MMSGVLSPAFLQAACAKHIVKNSIKIVVTGGFSRNIIIGKLSCSGTIVVRSIKDGVAKKEIYKDLTDATISVQNDINSTIEITGDVLSIETFNGASDYAAYFREFDAMHCDTLGILTMSSLISLTKLRLGNNIESVSLGDTRIVNEISYPANNDSVSTAIASIISSGTVNDGTVYTDSEGAYYSTIADAATAKGWTIEQLA